MAACLAFTWRSSDDSGFLIWRNVKPLSSGATAFANTTPLPFSLILPSAHALQPHNQLSSTHSTLCKHLKPSNLPLHFISQTKAPTQLLQSTMQQSFYRQHIHPFAFKTTTFHTGIQHWSRAWYWHRTAQLTGMYHRSRSTHKGSTRSHHAHGPPVEILHVIAAMLFPVHLLLHSETNQQCSCSPFQLSRKTTVPSRGQEPVLAKFPEFSFNLSLLAD